MLRKISHGFMSMAMRQRASWILACFLWFQLSPALCASSSGGSQFSTINNGVIEVGVDLKGGGSIGYISTAQTHGNVVNIHDYGRYIGQSYYSGPRPFGSPNSEWADWPWNPVSAGDLYGNASQVVACQNNGNTIYVKSVPKQWALNNVGSECTFETWLRLENNVVRVDNRLVNSRSDTTQYKAYTQELPALYTTARLWKAFAYTGSKPYTGDSLTQLNNNGAEWLKVYATEDWLAAVDNNNWGLGVYHPGRYRYLTGFVGGQPGVGGPNDPPTNYIAPLGREVLDHNIVYSYTYYLVLGTLDEIRNFVYSNHQSALPNYVFATDRQHFHYVNASDSGWPIQGHLHVDLGQLEARVVAPDSAWQAESVPSLLVNAAYHINSARPSANKVKGRIHLNYLGISGLDTAFDFNIIPDGNYHTYQVNLAQSPNHHGIVTYMDFSPVANGGSNPGDSVDIASITYPGAPAAGAAPILPITNPGNIAPPTTNPGTITLPNPNSGSIVPLGIERR